MAMFRRLSNKTVRWLAKLEHYKKQSSVFSTALVWQEQMGSAIFKKPGLNLCLRK